MIMILIVTTNDDQWWWMMINDGDSDGHDAETQWPVLVVLREFRIVVPKALVLQVLDKSLCLLGRVTGHDVSGFDTFSFSPGKHHLLRSPFHQNFDPGSMGQWCIAHGCGQQTFRDHDHIDDKDQHWQWTCPKCFPFQCWIGFSLAQQVLTIRFTAPPQHSESQVTYSSHHSTQARTGINPFCS